MLGSINVEKEEDKLSLFEVDYWKRIVKSNLKIGVEIETNLDNETSHRNAIDTLRNTFNPTRSYGKFGDFGVMEVKDDGSLSNGVELCTIGRRVNFLDLYNQYDVIIQNIMRYKPIMNERCGLHNHILIDYGTDYNSLEKNMPGVILKNFIQLIKRHMPELAYITSTVNTKQPNHLGEETQFITRMDRFCTADTLIKTSVIPRTLLEFKNIVSDPNEYTGRYKFINLRPMKVEDDEVTRFHLELRFPDGSIYPAQIAAQNILYAAILIKAIELSELGVITTGSSLLWEETKTLYTAFRNSYEYCGGRLSTPPTEEQLNKIKERCKNMLLEFKTQIMSAGKQAYPILNILCETPISVQRRTCSDKEINDNFEALINNMYTSDLSVYESIIKSISLQKITKKENENTWCNALAITTREPVQDIKNRIYSLSQIRELYFDKEIGSYAFK